MPFKDLMDFKVFSPTGMVFQESVFWVSLLGEKGRFMIYPRHMNLFTYLKPEPIVFKTSLEEKTFDVQKGWIAVISGTCNLVKIL